MENKQTFESKFFYYTINTEVHYPNNPDKIVQLLTYKIFKDKGKDYDL